MTDEPRAFVTNTTDADMVLPGIGLTVPPGATVALGIAVPWLQSDDLDVTDTEPPGADLIDPDHPS